MNARSQDGEDIAIDDVEDADEKDDADRVDDIGSRVFRRGRGCLGVIIGLRRLCVFEGHGLSLMQPLSLYQERFGFDRCRGIGLELNASVCRGYFD